MLDWTLEGRWARGVRCAGALLVVLALAAFPQQADALGSVFRTVGPYVAGDMLYSEYDGSVGLAGETDLGFRIGGGFRRGMVAGEIAYVRYGEYAIRSDGEELDALDALAFTALRSFHVSRSIEPYIRAGLLVPLIAVGGSREDDSDIGLGVTAGAGLQVWLGNSLLVRAGAEAAFAYIQPGEEDVDRYSVRAYTAAAGLTLFF